MWSLLVIKFVIENIWSLSITKEVTRGYLLDLMAEILTTFLVKKSVTKNPTQKIDYRKSVTKLVTKNQSQIISHKIGPLISHKINHNIGYQTSHKTDVYTKFLFPQQFMYIFLFILTLFNNVNINKINNYYNNNDNINNININITNINK